MIKKDKRKTFKRWALRGMLSSANLFLSLDLLFFVSLTNLSLQISSSLNDVLGRVRVVIMMNQQDNMLCKNRRSGSEAVLP